MRSIPRGNEDLTTTARIRDAAIGYFGEHGFRQTTIRVIAARAGVSAALVIHHFGSKDGLREACDAYVTDLIDRETAHAATELAPSDMLAMMARRPEFTFLAPYLVKALIEGGDFADRLFDRLIEDMEKYLQATVDAGIARPTGNERTRAEMVTLIKLGLLVFAPYVVPRDTPADRVLQLAADRLTLPALELFTNGLYSGTGYLDAYRALQAEQPAAEQPPAAPTPAADGRTGPGRKVMHANVSHGNGAAQSWTSKGEQA